MENRFYDLNTYFKDIFGHRVHKIAIDAGMSCPNRDGTLSTRGCIYCNERGSGTGFFQQGLSITDQIENAKRFLAKRYKARKFIAYFQAFTNTYAPLPRLRRLYDEALAVADVAGLSIGTRPDCVNEEILSLLESYAKTHLIWIEYGLQSAHDRTLALINRGHNFNAFEEAVRATRNRGIKICVHVILGLPGESQRDMLETAKIISQMGLDGIKFHMLYVVRGTAMEAMYRQGAYPCMTRDAYVDVLCEFLACLPKTMVIQRLTSDPHPDELVAPGWAMEKKQTLELIHQTLKEMDLYQGKHFQGV
ncbi:MAG: TIGR01212 family radical SAM protein [Desulfobacterales bacterium CG23_combo_of_CG06-09_8_20_14_all_51_8]|nr:MAG: TIGR01212 family radical SAM protein [Desulfobacterales bacterium CG23_combo_of_CG06-09_8_20_14_all_51_8]